jgi:hypothetical protein
VRLLGSTPAAPEVDREFEAERAGARPAAIDVGLPRVTIHPTTPTTTSMSTPIHTSPLLTIALFPALGKRKPPQARRRRSIGLDGSA